MDKPMRPQRNRRHSRRAWPPEDDLHYPRLAKRLFTPEIKRMLKEWLIRRRENPYPSREEKKRLAIDTGLTYTQICNWFANWRRKLKNSEREKSKKSWGHLIKNYNCNAKGNVEQFSISSEDSIWEEEAQQYNTAKRLEKCRARVEKVMRRNDEEDDDSLCDVDGSSYSGTDAERNNNSGSSYCGGVGGGAAELTQTQMFKFKPNFYTESTQNIVQNATTNLFIGRDVDVFTTTMTGPKYQIKLDINGNNRQQQEQESSINLNAVDAGKTKYKQKIMEKYLRDTNDRRHYSHHLHSQEQQSNELFLKYQMENPDCSNNLNNNTMMKSGAELSKWLESAANFTPNKNNYYIEWNNKRNKLEGKANASRNNYGQQQQASSPTVTVTSLMFPTLLHQQQTSSASSISSSSNNSSCSSSPFLTSNQATQIVQNQLGQQQQQYDATIHHKDELDAAEALANLAFNCRQRMLDSNAKSPNTATFNRPLNAISS